MAPSNPNPIFTITPEVKQVSISVANTNRDGTGTLGSVITGAANGTRIDRIHIKATVTTTAGMIRLFIYDGTNTYLFTEQLTAGATPDGTHKAEEFDIFPIDGLVLPNAYILKASTHNAETWIVTAIGGDY